MQRESMLDTINLFHSKPIAAVTAVQYSYIYVSWYRVFAGEPRERTEGVCHAVC